MNRVADSGPTFSPDAREAIGLGLPDCPVVEAPVSDMVYRVFLVSFSNE